MGKEIECKFLVKSEAWRELAKGSSYRQGYLSTVKERTVRIRTVDNAGFLTIKGVAAGATRAEYEYKIPAADAHEMLTNLCEQPLVEKTRYKIPQGDLTWEIDEFSGENKGLIVAEIELKEEGQKFGKPDWIGEEVTGDPKYFNSNLSKIPFTKWTK
ncbi:MAG: CYTH domain-containing protein [Candidatus Ozemobacteraceae bacterium]